MEQKTEKIFDKRRNFDANEKVSFAQSKKDERLKRVLSLLPSPVTIPKFLIVTTKDR